MVILRNAIQTPDGTILESHYRHDYVTHKDRKTGKLYGVDGGRSYCRKIGEMKDCKNLTVIDDGKHATRREALSWGRNYTKEEELLPETEYILIKDMDTDHIEKILELYEDRLPKVYRDGFLDEVIWREEEIIKEYDEIFKYCPQQQNIFSTDL